MKNAQNLMWGIVAFAVGVGLSVWLTIATGFPFILLPVAFPFMFRLGSRSADYDSADSCDACGYEARDATESYCPRDGSRLLPSNPARGT